MSICQMEAYLMNGNGAGTGFQVSLPISREEFLSAAAAIGVGDSGKDNLFVAAVEPKMKELAPHLKPPFDIGELNYLAAKLEQLESKSDEQRDIPSEFQVSPFRDAMPLLRLENTNLTDVLTKIHDLGGCENDLARNLETLHRRRSANFLLLLTNDKAVLSEAMHVYRRGTAAHDAFVENSPAKMYSIYVTDFQTEFIGDIRELDASLRRVDIHDYSIDFVAVEVETEDGESITFTPAEWKNVTAEERDCFQSWTRKFADGDYTKVLRHIEYQTSADDFWARTASLEEFFSKLAQDFSAKTERTPEARPKSVLERIAAARAERSETPDLQTPKHRTEPER